MNSDTNASTENDLSEYITKPDFLKIYPNLFTKSELTFLILDRENNGFSRCVHKISAKKIFLHLPSVIKFIRDSRK